MTCAQGDRSDFEQRQTLLPEALGSMLWLLSVDNLIYYC